MSSTDTIATTASDPTAVVATAQFLTPVVLGLQGLTINAKQAHWHVRGSNFVGVHELLDTIAGNAGEFADAVLFFASPWARAITGQNLIVDGGLVKN